MCKPHYMDGMTCLDLLTNNFNKNLYDFKISKKMCQCK
jgi:hypothetical protein